MTPDSIFVIINDWLLHLLAGVLLSAFAYLIGVRKAEKTTMSKADCEILRKSSDELHQKDDVIHDQKLQLIQNDVQALSRKVDDICKGLASLRGTVIDYFGRQGYQDRRKAPGEVCDLDSD